MAVTLQNTLNEQSKSYLGITPDHTHHYNTRKALERIAGSLSSIDNNTNTSDTPSPILATPTNIDEEEGGANNNNEGTSDVTSERHSDVSYTREEEEEELENFEYLEEKEIEGITRVTRSRSKIIQEQIENDSNQEEEEEEEEERVRRSRRRKTRNKSKHNKRWKIQVENDFNDDVPIIRMRAGRVTYRKHRYS